MRKLGLVLLLVCCVRAYGAAIEKPASDASVQAVNVSIQQLNAQVQTLNSSVTALNSSVQGLAAEIREFYGGLEYVLLAIVQAVYFAVGLALFYIFDRGRLARDIW